MTDEELNWERRRPLLYVPLVPVIKYAWKLLKRGLAYVSN